MTEHNIFQEVQDDLERQKLEALWKQYAGWLVAAALAILLVTAGSTAYRSWRAERNEKLTAGLLDAGKAGADAAKNIAAMEKFAADNPGADQGAFALLRAGALAAEQNDKAKAAHYFDMVAQDAKADETFRQLGDLLSVQAQMDGGDAKTLSARLDPLTAEHGAWRFPALEDQGYLALQTGDKDKARHIFTLLSQDAQAPASLAARAGDIAHSLD